MRFRIKEVTSIIQKIYYDTSQGSQSKDFKKTSESISLNGREITTIDFIQFGNFPFLKTIYLSSTSIIHLSTYGIDSCQRLEYLSISFNHLDDLNLASLEKCSQLEKLGLSSNNLVKIDLSRIAEHPCLKTIDLGYNLLTDIDFIPLGSIPNLETIVLYKNQLQEVDLNPLSKSKSLMHLNLGNNSLRSIDLTPLRNVKTLRDITFAINKLDHIDISPLSEMESLEKVDLQSNTICKIDLSPLARCRLLKQVNLRGNQIQELDISPLLFCPNLEHFLVDDKVRLWVPKKYKPSTPIPNWIRLLKQDVQVRDIDVDDVYEKQVSRRKNRISYIDLQGFDGLMFDLVQEINDAFNAECYVCTAFLSRKLLKSLVISIMQKLFGKTNHEYYLSRDKTRTRSFGKVLSNFWKVFPDHIQQFSPIFDRVKIDKIEKEIGQLKDDFNIDVHQPGSFTDKDKLLDVRRTLVKVTKFLKHIDEKIT